MSAVQKTAAGETDTERDWLTTGEFANYMAVTPRVVLHWVKDGKVKSQPHPTRPRNNVIPYSELRRILQFEEGNVVSYDGRTYPHQIYLFYLSARNGLKIAMTKKDLALFKLHVPPDEELIELARSVYESAPKSMLPIFKKHRRCVKRPEFADWIEKLGFGELFEDELGYIPYHAMKNDHVRWALEICSGAGFKPIDTSNIVRTMCDVVVDPRQVVNYTWLFYYTRQMPQTDWNKFIADEYRRDTWTATVREECIDNPVGVFTHFKIKHKLSMPDTMEEMLWQMKHKFDHNIQSNNLARQSHAMGLAKTMNSIFSSLLRAKEVGNAESEALHAKRQAASGYMEGGLNPTSIPEKTLKDEAPTFEELVGNYKDRVKYDGEETKEG